MSSPALRFLAIPMAITIVVGVLSGSVRAQDGPSPPAASQAPAQPAAPQDPSQQPPTGAAPGTPQEPVPAGRAGVVPPRLVYEQKPSYTPEAMRARIQGAVRLRGIVELDGTISNIEVVQPLDPTYGLDNAAVTALQQWRFQPGTMNGRPVRVLVTIDMRFALRTDVPTQSWPTGSSTAPERVESVDQRAEAGDLRITLPRPVVWTTQPAAALELLSVASSDGLESISVLRPLDGAQRLTYPVDAPLLQQIAESLRRVQPADMGAETIATGQVQAATGTFWVWSLMRLPNVPAPAGVPPDQNPVGEARLWTFSHSVDGKLITVWCRLLLPRNLPTSAVEQRVQRAASDFSAIVDGIAVEKVAQ